MKRNILKSGILNRENYQQTIDEKENKLPLTA
jgi:hypothetical protein